MFSEVMHGVIGRTQNNACINQNHPDAELGPCDLRIGIIPAGEKYILLKRQHKRSKYYFKVYCRIRNVHQQIS